MQVEKTNNRNSGRFERFNIVFPILLAGWVPSIAEEIFTEGSA
jgi:hypothetical protein